MSGSVGRIIAVMEALRVTGAESGSGEMTAQEVVERSGLPASTGYRILSEMQGLGLVHRTPSRKLLANFVFERRVSDPGVDPERLAVACAALSSALTSAAEAVVLSGQNILWHIVEQHPDQAVRLRAYPGFARTSYELDSISRLVLAHLPEETLLKQWDPQAFFSAGVHRAPLDWEEVRRTIASVDCDGMQYDMMGNSKGIRRFCVAVHTAGKGLACLLTVAEAATPVRDEAAHVERIRTLLMTQRRFVENRGDREDCAG